MLRGIRGRGGGIENSSSTKRLRVGESSGDSLETELEAIANGVYTTCTLDISSVSPFSPETSAKPAKAPKEAENCRFQG
jgi:hypothetical protein